MGKKKRKFISEVTLRCASSKKNQKNNKSASIVQERRYGVLIKKTFKAVKFKTSFTSPCNKTFYCIVTTIADNFLTVDQTKHFEKHLIVLQILILIV